MMRKTEDRYVLKSETVYPNGSVVRVMSPILTDEERERRLNNLKRAAGVYAQHMFEGRAKNENNNN
jgi:hypothetical protein